MSYLSRENSGLAPELWKEIDSVVVAAAGRALTGRRFLHVFGPLGPGAQSIAVDAAGETEEVPEDGLITTRGRKFVEIPAVYEDFTLSARDLEYSKKQGIPVDLSNAKRTAEACARREDRLIYFGSEKLGYEGLLTAPGVYKIKRSDWSAGENAFSDIASAVASFTSKGIYGSYALAVSPDLYYLLQRIQPGTGLLEIDRIAKLVSGGVLNAPALGAGKALLVCSEPENMDLVIGQDLAAAYLEQKELNHSFRLLETILLRIKNKDAIAVFE